MKKFIAVLLVLAFTAGMAVFAETAVAGVNMGARQPVAENAFRTGKSVESETPSEPEAPAETETPGETEAPAETEAPGEPEAPAETEAPAEPEETPKAEDKPEGGAEPDQGASSSAHEKVYVSNVPVNDKWWNILLLGGDSRSAESYGRTDSMIIVSINQQDARVKMTSVMRDTWVQYPGYSKKGKINAANVYGGPELAIKTVNECFGTNIEQYVLVNMAELVKIVDLVGGIDLEITEGERELINSYAQDYVKSVTGGAQYSGQTHLDQSGMVHLNGVLATAYARNRYSDSDYGRVMRQQKILLGVAQKASGMNFVELLALAKEMLAATETNLDLSQVAALAATFLQMDLSGIEQYRIPADGTFESGMYGNEWSIRPNFSQNQKYLREFIYAE